MGPGLSGSTRSFERGGGDIIDTPEKFATALDNLRKNSGKSYRRLAQECGLGFTTIAGYCSGRHLPQLSVESQFARLIAAIGVSPGVATQRWFDALRRLRARAEQNTPIGANPYLGLRSFQQADAGRFFGRDTYVRRLLAALEHTGRLLVVGPSGVGKSSLLRAGVMPRRTPSVVLTPGADPLREWHAQAPDTLVVVDQLEELFTLCDSDDRSRFLDLLRTHRGPLLLGLRADFYGRALDHSFLAELAQRSQLVVEPMTTEQCREVIVRPAQSAGIELEEGLVELLLRDTAREPAGLPMLSHTLHTVVEIARQADTGRPSVGLRHYRLAGGVSGAVARSAEKAYESLTPARAVVARGLFMRLVSTSSGTGPTRRQVRMDELFSDHTPEHTDDMAEVLDVFVSHRLLTTGKGTIEIGHEALLHAWPRLRKWLSDDQVGHHVHGRLTAAATAWQDDGNPVDSLYRGGVLVTAVEWANSTNRCGAPNALEREFLAESTRVRDEAELVARRRVRRRYQLTCVLVALVLVAGATALYARRVVDDVDETTRLGSARQTAATAERVSARDPALAAQLAIAGHETAATPETRAAVLDMSARPLPYRTDVDGATIAAASDLVAVGTNTGTVRLFRLTDRLAPIDAELLPGANVTSIALDAAGTRLATGDEAGVVSVWDLGDRHAPTIVTTCRVGVGAVSVLRLSPDGRQVVAGTGTSTLRLCRPGASVELTGPTSVVRSALFVPGDLLLAGGDDGTIHRWDVAGSPRPLPALTGPKSRIFTLATSSDGRLLAAGTGAEHNVHLWDLSDPARPLGAPLTGPASWVTTVGFSPDGRTLAAGSSDNKVWQWNLGTRELVGTLPHPAPVSSVIYRDDHTLTTLASDGYLRVWNVPGPLLVGSVNQVFSSSFDATGDRLLVGAGDGALRLWDVAEPARPRLAAPVIRNDDPAHGVLAGASLLLGGRLLLAGSNLGYLYVWAYGTTGPPARVGTPTKIVDGTIQAIVPHPNGHVVAISGDDGLVRLVDLTTPSKPMVVSVLRMRTGTAYGARFTSDGRFLAVATDGRTGYVWDVANLTRPRLRTKITDFPGPVYAVAFDPANTMVAFAGSDYATRLFQVGEWHELAVLRGPVGEIYELVFHPNKDLLAVSSIDGTVRLWDVSRPDRPELVGTLAAAQSGIFTIAFSPDGAYLVAGGRDDAVRMWNTDVDAVTAWICATAGDPITPHEWSQFIPDRPYDPPCR